MWSVMGVCVLRCVGICVWVDVFWLCSGIERDCVCVKGGEGGE